MADRAPVTPLLTWFLVCVAMTPFLLFAVLAFVAPGVTGSSALIWLPSWAAVVLSFTGGARWGLEVGRRGNAMLMLAGLAPALAAFSALSLPIQYQGGRVPLVIIATAFVAGGAWDLVSPGTPRWYKPMATAIAVAALIGLGAAWVRVGQIGL